MEATRGMRRNVLRGMVAAGSSVLVSRLAIGQTALKPLLIFIGPTPHLGNVIVGVEKGFFEREKLPIQVQYFTTGATSTQAFRSGLGNLVNAGELPSLRLWNTQGGVAICPSANYSHLSIVVAKKNINSAADMRGKKIGVILGSSSEYFARLYLAKGNVAPAEVQLINLSPDAMLAGLIRNDIDGFVIWQPWGWRALEASKDVQIVTNADNYFSEWLFFSAQPSQLETHANEYVAFIKGLDAASKWCMENPVEAADVYSKVQSVQDLTIARRMMGPAKWTVAITPKCREDVARVAKFDGKEIDWNKMFDTRFLRTVNPSYVS